MMGAIDGRLFNIKGGNRQLAERLIKAADASLHLGTRVTGIHRRKHGMFALHTKLSSASTEVWLAPAGPLSVGQTLMDDLSMSL